MENVIKKKENMKSKKSNKGMLAAIIVSTIVGALAMYLVATYAKPISEVGQTIINKSEKEVTITDTGIADAVEKLYDAVVVVKVYKQDTLYATGTGFVYKTNGDKAYILTNNHVVSGGTSVKVEFTDNREIETKVEGADAYSDLAILSLSSSDVIKVAEIGKTDSMRLGDTVFTIGAPLDTTYYWSVTRGVLSGKDRMVEINSSSGNAMTADSFVMRVLQTDASINSGNSGGPLANSNGEVVGITNMKLANGAEGMGFAIPIEDAVAFAEAIIEGKNIAKPLLGVQMIDLSSNYYYYLETDLTSGVVIMKVQDGSPASHAKLKKGDIIIGMDDVEIKDVAHLRYYLYKHTVGDTITIKYERDGKVETTKVKLSASSEN